MNVLKKLLKEILYFIIILIILAISLHPDLLSDPMGRFKMMSYARNYGHPFFWAAIGYVVVAFHRLFFWGAKRMMKS